MSEPFIGQIQPFGFNFCPRGWAGCDGQLLAISSNTALFSLLEDSGLEARRLRWLLGPGKAHQHPG